MGKKPIVYVTHENERISIKNSLPYSNGSSENEALENEDRSTKHPKLENEAPYLENKAPKNS